MLTCREKSHRNAANTPNVPAELITFKRNVDHDIMIFPSGTTSASLAIGLSCASPQAMSGTLAASFSPGGSVLMMFLTNVGQSTR